MGIAAKGEADRGEKLRETVGTALFMAIFLFFWISLNPFVDLTGEAVLDPSAGNSNLMNQIVSLLLFAGTLAYGLLHPMRSIILQPRVLLGLLFAWFFLVSLISSYPMLGIKGTVLAVMVTVNASIYLLLPASERHFAKMLGIGTLIMLGVSYYGILFKPLLAIHQASELREPMNAGLWRGHFPHKNSAAAAMVVASFFGLFVMNAWSRIAGMTILCLSFLFLINTGGKTSTAMLPAILLLAWVFEKVRFLRIPIVIGGVGAFNIFAIGAAVFRPLGDFINELGIDATFTNRADIWRFAVSELADRPLTGYGFKGFWQTSELVHSGGSIETWAVAAANGHNSYLDVALMTGIPGLLLTLVWLVVLPLRNISRLEPDAEHSHLTRLFTRIWLYAIFNAGLESLFFEGGNSLWFTLLFALYGLSLQASAALAPERRTQPEGAVAHA
ncbi:O-antigen ligase family protein [Bosea sp. 2RAB26]|uniref:O-antigen ligase family protein n=1 Tax=Bosea sp. 2RAB26 TaxID=3237476 RepID=UPI003F91E871